jgi:colicin import membrane protein
MLEELRQFNGMTTGQTIVDTLDFGRRLSGSSNKSASKRHKTTGTTPLNTTDFIPSNKVDVDKASLEKVESEEVKAEKKRAKEAKEANTCEEREGAQKAIEEANLLGRKSKEETKKRAKEAKEEAKKEAKEEAKKRAKDAKATMQAEKEKEEGGIGPSSTSDSKEHGGWVEQADKQVESDF